MEVWNMDDSNVVFLYFQLVSCEPAQRLVPSFYSHTQHQSIILSTSPPTACVSVVLESADRSKGHRHRASSCVGPS